MTDLILVLAAVTMLVASIGVALAWASERACHRHMERALREHAEREEPEAYPTIRAEDLRAMDAAILRRLARAPITRRAPSRAEPDTIERLIGRTVEEP